MTDADGILRELRAREPLFHRPEPGASRADIEAMVARDFFEIGASGRLIRCMSRFAT